MPDTIDEPTAEPNRIEIDWEQWKMENVAPTSRQSVVVCDWSE